jgi:hypothetical protein
MPCLQRCIAVMGVQYEPGVADTVTFRATVRTGRFLYLWSNNLTGTIPAQLSALTALQ